MKRRSFIKFAAAAIAALGLSKVVPAEPYSAEVAGIIPGDPHSPQTTRVYYYDQFAIGEVDKIAFSHATERFNLPALSYRERCGKILSSP